MIRIQKMTRLALVIAAAAASATAARAQERPRDFTMFGWTTDGRGYLGAQVQSLTPELRVHFGVSEDEGVLVARVEEDGPAAGAGVLVGDIITALDGRSVESAADIVHVVREKKTGEMVQVEVWRDGAAMTLPVTVSERDRRVMDLADYRFVPNIDDLPEHDVFIARPGQRLGLHLDRSSVDALEEVMESLSERFESEEWKTKLDKLRELDLSTVEERMREVERRLKELEEELAKEPNRR